MSPVVDHTSVPPWALEATALKSSALEGSAQGSDLTGDLSAAACTILSYDAGEIASRWGTRLTELGVPHETVPLAPCGAEQDEETLSQEREMLARCLGRARVGWRLMIAGPLADVLRARSAALEAGLLDEEILVATTRIDLLPVACAHCEEITLVEAKIDDVVDCPSCLEPLLIYHHVSRRLGSFLGFKADAEEWSAEEWSGQG